MAYSDFKYLPRRTNSHKLLCDKAFNIAKNLKYDECPGFASMVYNFFNKKSATTDANKSATNTGKWINFENQQLADELYKKLIKKLMKHKVLLKNW